MIKKKHFQDKNQSTKNIQCKLPIFSILTICDHS